MSCFNCVLFFKVAEYADDVCGNGSIGIHMRICSKLTQTPQSAHNVHDAPQRTYASVAPAQGHLQVVPCVAAKVCPAVICVKVVHCSLVKLVNGIVESMTVHICVKVVHNVVAVGVVEFYPHTFSCAFEFWVHIPTNHMHLIIVMTVYHKCNDSLVPV